MIGWYIKKQRIDVPSASILVQYRAASLTPSEQSKLFSVTLAGFGAYEGKEVDILTKMGLFRVVAVNVRFIA